MKPPPFSLIVIAAGRPRHLANLLRGCEIGSRPPAETILVRMDDSPAPAAVRLVACPTTGTTLPLAAARNVGARAATHEQLVFLDVDCIPGRLFFGTITHQLAVTGGLIMGLPHYLFDPVDAAFNEATLAANSTPHPGRPPLAADLETTPHYHLFWSLCFGIRRRDFERIGGFDESFVGYGGEDTDFAFTARERGVPFHLSSATVYHQPHPVTDPPVSHLVDIVANANAFHAKWHTWPMKSWLAAFRDLGLVQWDADSSDSARLLRPPTAELSARLTRQTPF